MNNLLPPIKVLNSQLSPLSFIDTHCHLDGEEFADDRDAVVQRAREAGCKRIFLPAIDVKSCKTVLDVCAQYPDFCYPMLGLHPEEVRADWREQLRRIREYVGTVARGCENSLSAENSQLSNLVPPSPRTSAPPKLRRIREYVGTVARGCENSLSAENSQQSNLVPPSPRTSAPSKIIAIGEVGLDYYWSREFEQEQLQAFEEQVRWAVEMQLPLMIHCRKAQNEMVHIIKRYAHDLPGGVFHCFTGNEQEALQLLEFDRFVLGIGGVLTFKKSHLPETLAAVVPLDRIVLETDAPYMAPVPMRGQRNESSFIRYVITRLAEAYGVSEEEICRQTNENVQKVFGIQI